MNLRLLSGLSALLLLTACHQNPYAGRGERVTPDPVHEKPSPGPVGYDVEVAPAFAVQEGQSTQIKIIPHVPSPGKPVLIFDTTAPAFKFCSPYDPVTATITCNPKLGDALDTAAPNNNFRTYTMTMKLSSTDDAVTQLPKAFTINVTHMPVNLTVTGLNTEQIILEGQTYTTTVTFNSPDAPQGPFYPSVTNLPAGMTVTPTNDPTKYTISFTPGYGTVGWGHFNSICSDVNWNDHLCTYIPFMFTVLDKRGNAVTVNASWSILDVRQDPFVVVPTGVTGTATGADFYVQVEDPNAEVVPTVTASVALTAGKLTTTVANSGMPKGANPYTLIHVSWTGDLSTLKGTAQKVDLKSCVQDFNGAINKCVTTPVSVQF